MAEEFIRFLGTAGARFVMARQLRYSAGTFLSLKGQRLMLDPGPGTLLRCAKARPPVDPGSLDAVVLTHAHIDHSGDVNALLDAMTAGGFKQKGHLFAPADCLEGRDPVVLRYVRRGLESICVLAERTDYRLGSLEFSTSVRHRHPVETYGLKFRAAAGTVSFLVDTEPFDGLAEQYTGTDVLVLNVVLLTPRRSPTVMHLDLGAARELIAAIRPRKAVLTHYGMTMLKAKPRKLAAALSEELGIEVLAASDGMRLPLG